MSSTYKYRAFITYAHKDEEKARWLRKKLEDFKVPKHLIGQNSDFGPIPSRLYPIFRDRDELAGAAQLGPLIEQALDDSSHLIILCSPHAVQSRWVNEEIRMFKAMGKEDRVLCLVLSGEPMVEDSEGDSQKECIPLAARRQVDSNGEISEQKHEPAAADLRDSADGEKNSLLKLVAGLIGVGLDELKQRDLLARQKRLVRITAVSAFLAISAISLAVYAMFQQQQAKISRANAEIERQLAEVELAKTQTITTFVQNLFISLDPQNTAGMDTELLKTMLDQGSSRANELAEKPEIEAKIRLCLGQTYRSIRSYEKAQIELERVLTLYHRPDDLNLTTRLQAMNEIAMVHDALGNYVEAEPMLEELLVRRTHSLGVDHNDVIDAQIDLAIVYRRIGKFEQAENRCTTSLSQLNDQNRSQDDPMLLRCMTELSKIYLDSDKVLQAESLARNTYERSRLSFGANHPKSLRRGQVLVECLRKLGRLDDAQNLSNRIVSNLQFVLGQSHPDTLGAMDSLANIAAARNDLNLALEQYLEILKLKEQALGSMHPETLNTLNATAEIYRRLDMLEEAKKAQYMVYQRLQEKYGHEHPETLRSMNELADLHLELGEEDNAFSISERALEIERSIMGEEDPMTLNTLFRIGKLHYLAQRTDEAMVILGETLSKQEKLLGFDNAEVTLTRDLLNRILGERATAIKVTSDNYHTDEFDELGPPLPEFLRPKDQINSPTISLEENASSISPESDQKEITPDDDDKINKEGNSGFFQSIKKTLKIGLDPEDTSPN
jgi:tetratricopeptide (TPR) repeat protein